MRSSFIFKRVLLILCLCLPLPAAAAPVIMVFGDSLSSGYGLPHDAGWVSLLNKRLQQQRLDYGVVNTSISGETTRGGASRIAQSLEAHHPSIVILELGGNDGLRGQPVSATRDNLEAIIEACQLNGAKVLLIGMRLPPNYGITYTQKFHDIYPALAKRYRLPLIPFMLEGLPYDPSMFQADGVHPTAAAQPIILDNIWKTLKSMLG